MPEATKLSSVVTDFTELRPLNSVLKIKNKFGSDLNSFDFQQITTSEVKKLLKEIDIKKAAGVDTIPPKLIKIGADIIAEPLTQAINCCLRQGIFPDNAKIASVLRLRKTGEK